MANYLGYALQAGVQGFQTGFSMAQQKSEMEWQKKKKKELEEKELKIKEGAVLYSSLVSQVYADNVISEDEMMKLNTAFLAAGYEVQAVIKDTHNAIQTMDKNKLEQDLAWLDLFADMTEGLDPKDTQGTFDMIKGNIKSEKGINLFDAYGNLQTKKYEVAKEEEPWKRATVLPSEMRVPYLKQEGVEMPEIAPTTEPLSVAERKFNMAMMIYEKNKNMDMLLKYLGMDVTPEKKSALKEKLDEMDKLGATTEEKKKWILGEGGSRTTITPTPTSVESVREAIINAPTLEDAKRIEKNHITKYGETTGIPNVDKFWSDERVRRLTTLKQGIDKLLDENKRLKKGNITSADVGFEIEDDVQKVEAVYQQLREEYMKYRDMLEKMGVDLSQFPELMSYEEYLKTDIKPGMGIFYPSTWGKQKPSIY